MDPVSSDKSTATSLSRSLQAERPHSPKREDDTLSVEHISPEAIAAYVDGELSPRALHRAKVHLVHCTECREEVQLQRRAAEYVRSQAADVQCSGQLLERLASIPGELAARTHKDEDRHFRVDGCRKPETVMDAVDLIVRRLQRRGRSED